MKAIITIDKHRTPDGKPTCARDFAKGEVCEFLVTCKFGTEFRCVFDLEGRVWHSVDGFLAPCERCRVWNEKERANEHRRPGKDE